MRGIKKQYVNIVLPKGTETSIGRPRDEGFSIVCTFLNGNVLSIYPDSRGRYDVAVKDRRTSGAYWWNQGEQYVYLDVDELTRLVQWLEAIDMHGVGF